MSKRVLRSKRRREDDEPTVSAKRQRTLAESEVESMDLNGLLDALGSNNAMNRMVKDVFSRKYGDKTISLFMKNLAKAQTNDSKRAKKNKQNYKVVVSLLDDTAGPSTSIGRVLIDAETFIVKLGKLVTRIKIDYSVKDVADYQRWRAIERLIIEHCGESLTQLSLEYNMGNAFDKLSKPFPKLEKLCLENSILTSKMASITKFFPNVNHLVLNCSGFDSIKLVGSAKDSAASQFAIHSPKTGGDAYFNSKVQDLARNFNNEKYRSIDFLQTVNKNMKQLTHLEVRELKLAKPGGSAVVHFGNVTDFVIHLRESDPLKTIPFSFDKLDGLNMVGFIEPKTDVLAFLTDLSGLTKLDFQPGKKYGNIDDTLGEIADKLKNLMELTISDYGGSISKENLIEFITGCKELRNLRIRFHFGDEDSRDTLINGLDEALPGWNVQHVTKKLKFGTRNDLLIERKAGEQ